MFVRLSVSINLQMAWIAKLCTGLSDNFYTFALKQQVLANISSVRHRALVERLYTLHFFPVKLKFLPFLSLQVLPILCWVATGLRN